MNSTHVVLRRVKDADGSRLLEASLTVDGDLLIEGWDLGDGVERIFGVREYEWAWTIRAANLPALLSALGVTTIHWPRLKIALVGRTRPCLAPSWNQMEFPLTVGRASVTNR